jgi:hypothetical protein
MDRGGPVRKVRPTAVVVRDPGMDDACSRAQDRVQEVDMKLAQANYDNRETGCCAPLDASRWDNQRVTWHDKPFVRGHVRSVMHVPLNLGAVMRRLHRAVEGAAAYPAEPLWLSDEVSPWGSDVYLAVEGDVPGRSVERLSGTFLTKVFEGPYRDAPKWLREMHEHARRQGESVEKVYFFYATCPSCAKRLGKNQVVLLAQTAGEKAAAA